MERRGDFGYDPWHLYGRPALAAAAALVVVVLVVLGTRMFLDHSQGGRPPADASPAASIRAPGATPTTGRGGTPVKSSPLAFTPSAPAGRTLVVTATGGLGLTLRAEPSSSAPALAALAEGARLTEVGPERTVEGRTWLNVRDESGNDGWVASEFTTPAP